MPLASGARLGPYEILTALGAGGMGEVYRARDTKLNRDVAVKVIPDVFATDPDRLARFEREAQALAALNHPNIAHVYGLERQDGREGQARALLSFIVMELVDGEELAQRIARGPLPSDEALPIATQIAEALEAAHEQGIIHRDLKPANIKIKPDGTVKVLDFGLAKAMDATAASSTSASISPTLSVHATQAGIILGTAAYMSPEQARGRPVDKRADIWAFGVVLYEMITGRKPFDGEDIGEVLAGVIKEQPRWDDVPLSLRRLLQRCLEKDPKKRLRDISGVGLLLEEPPAVSHAATRASAVPWIVAGAFALLAALALWAPWRQQQTESRPLIRLDVDLGTEFGAGNPQGTEAILSPDGSRLVWVSRNRLFTRRLNQPKPVELSATQGGYGPFFSPDGQWVAFFAGGKLNKVSVDGGAVIALCDASGARGGSWSEDGRIALSIDRSLFTISAAGGALQRVTQTIDTEQHRWPQMLPGNEAILFTNQNTAQWDDANIEVVTIRDGRRKLVQRGGTSGRYVARANGDGYLLYVSRSTLFAIPFDLDRLDVTGTPSPILEDVGYSPLNGSAQFDMSRSGTLVYRSGAAVSLVTLQWLDADGKTQPLPAKPAAYSVPRVSPDGNLLAVTIADSGGQTIWVYDWRRDAMTRLTFGAGTFTFPVWTPDGRNVVFSAGFNGGGMIWTRADGASKPRQLTEKGNHFPWSFSPDGKRLAFADFPLGANSGDIRTVPVDNNGGSLTAGQSDVFLQTPANELYPAFSPDGRWIAYRTLESGTSQIEVRAFPNQGGKWLISNNGGVVPIWSPNGRELFYRTEDQHIMVVSYTAKGDVFVPDKPRLWSDKRLAESGARNLDIMPDGKRFIVLMPSDSTDRASQQTRVFFLQNFSDEIARRIGTAK